MSFLLQEECGFYRYKYIVQNKRFMESLVKHKLIKSHPIFYKFITIKEISDFNHYKIKASKSEAPTMLRDYINREGLIYIRTSPEDDSLAQNIAKSIENKEILINRVVDAMKDLQTDMASVSNSMRQVSIAFNNLFQYSEASQEVNFDFY